MDETMNKPGEERPRVYRMPAESYDLSLLTELRHRVADQIKDLPEEVGNRRPPGVKNSIHFLVWHLCDGEGRWLSTFDAGLKEAYAAIFIPPFTKDDPIPRAALDGVFESSKRLLGLYAESGRPRTIPPRFGHERAALAHLHWHWAYHCGQIGLLRVMLGYPYTWKFQE